MQMYPLKRTAPLLAVGLLVLAAEPTAAQDGYDSSTGVQGTCRSNCDVGSGNSQTESKPKEQVPQTPEEEFRAFLDSAASLIAMGKRDQARAELDEALRLFPDDQEALALSQQMEGPATITGASVVDARSLVPFGADLPKVEEMEGSPGVDEWRKGMQAVANYDWPVALAWFQQALLKDPNNQGLLRVEYLAKFMIAYYQQNGGARPVFDPAWQRYETERLAKLARTQTQPEAHSALEQIAADPDFVAARDRIVAKQQQAEAQAAARAHQDMGDRLEALRVEAGLLNFKEMMIKEYADPAFRARVNAERDELVARWVQDEQAARSIAFQEMMAEVNLRLAAVTGQ